MENNFEKSVAGPSRRITIIAENVVRPALLPRRNILRQCLIKGAKSYEDLDSNSSTGSLCSTKNDDVLGLPFYISPPEVSQGEAVAEEQPNVHEEPSVHEVLTHENVDAVRSPELFEEDVEEEPHPITEGDLEEPQSPIIGLGGRRHERSVLSSTSSDMDTTFSQPDQRNVIEQFDNIARGVVKKVEEYKQRSKESGRRRHRTLQKLQEAKDRMKQHDELLNDLNRQLEELQRQVTDQKVVCQERRRAVAVLEIRHEAAVGTDREVRFKLNKYKRQLKQLRHLVPLQEQGVQSN